MNDFFVVLCPSELFFLNHSSAKESAVFSAKDTCERDSKTLTEYNDVQRDLKDKLDELEGRRVTFETQVENVDSLPALVKPLL